MNPASLSPALFSALPAATAATSGDAPVAGNASSSGNPAFAGLLQAAPVVASSELAADIAVMPGADPLAALDAGLELELDLDTDAAAEDAPWPPAGLEQLLAPPGSAPPPAPVASALAGAMTPAMQGAQADADADIRSAPASILQAGNTPAPLALGAQAMAQPPAGAANVQPADTAISLPASLALQPAAGARDAASSVNTPSPSIDTGSFAPLLGMSASIGTAATTATTIAAPVLPTSTELGNGQLEQDLAVGVDYMLDQKLQSARIRVAPAQLGMIDIELRLEGERVHAHFSSAHADVRQALSESLPRLRELLDQQGMQMGQTDVGSRSTDGAGNGNGNGNGDGQDRASVQSGSGNRTDDSAQDAPVWRRAGLLDTYA